MKYVALGDFLTDAQIADCVRLYKDGGRIAVRDQIIAPNMDEINRKLGQPNDPDYLSFVVEYVMGKAGVA